MANLKADASSVAQCQLDELANGERETIPETKKPVLRRCNLFLDFGACNLSIRQLQTI